MIDRYGQVGLTHNPFALGADASQAFVDRGVAEPSYEPGTIVQLIGPKGFGKTTQVRAWLRQRNGPYHYVAPERSARWATPPIARVVYADEIDRMAPLVRWRWFRQLAAVGASLIAGTHVDLSTTARRSGLTPTIHQLDPVDLPTLGLIVEKRIRLASLSDSPDATRFRLAPGELETVHRRACGSIRQAETLLHELVASHVAATPAT